MYNTNDVYGENKIKGTVKDSLCNSHKNNNNKSIEYDCSFNILYNIDNTDYKKHMDTYNTNNYSNGQQIDVRYNTYDKNDITTNTFSNQKIGVIVFFIGFVILIISGIYLYVLLKYKYVDAGVTAMSAVSTAVSTAVSPFNNNRY
jgi:cytochrome b subunit of formate dehydrogenase